MSTRHFAAALAIAVVVSACGASPAPSGTASPTVEMKEFSFVPASLSLRPGSTVTIRLRNTGTVEHEFMAGREGVGGVGYKEDWLARAGVKSSDGHSGGHSGVGVRVQPGKTATLTLTVPAETGRLEFGCFVAGHYEAGMKGTLTVE